MAFTTCYDIDNFRLLVGKHSLLDRFTIPRSQKRRFQKQGLKTWLETNGTLITKGLAHHMKEKTSIQHISVSVDGATASTHDHFRNVKGSFDLAIKGISQLSEAG